MRHKQHAPRSVKNHFMFFICTNNQVTHFYMAYQAAREAESAQKFKARAEALEHQREIDNQATQQHANDDLEAALVDANSALHATRTELHRAAKEAAATKTREAEALARIVSLENSLAALQRNSHSSQAAASVDHQQFQNSLKNPSTLLQRSNTHVGTTSSDGLAKHSSSPRQAVQQEVRQVALKRISALETEDSSAGGSHQVHNTPSSRRWGSDAFNNHEPIPLASTVAAKKSRKGD